MCTHIHARDAQVRDVAAAFDLILHKGVAGRIYNIGGSNEKANIDVARDIIRRMGLLAVETEGEQQEQEQEQEQEGRGKRDGGAEGDGDSGKEEQQMIEEAAGASEAAGMTRYITFVEDRFFNDLRYSVECSSLKALGWREQVRKGEGGLGN
jgi:dTDP-D-glucose 4,6-dehydratase